MAGSIKKDDDDNAPKRYINPTYANKETRDRLGDKSKRVFGTRSKWFKLANLYGMTTEQAEERLDMMIALAEAEASVDAECEELEKE